MTNKKISYLLKGIDPDFWIDVKLLSVIERITIKELILRAINLYIEGKDRPNFERISNDDRH